MKLNIELLKDNQNIDFFEDYKSCLNARGLYDSMQFVLRLRPDIHAKIDNLSKGINNIDWETMQALSTQFHETIHWWQHIGSISGLILSFSYPAQAHINHEHLKNYLKYTGLIKPITKYNQLNAKDERPSDKEFQTINLILNNFHDIEFFKSFIISPTNKKLIKSIVSDPLFESVGHSYHIAYSTFIRLISSIIDSNMEFLPNAKKWVDEFDKLRNDKITGYYYRSPIELPPVGLHEIYEWQARFLQMQCLYFGSGEKLTWDDFEKIGMLSGVYYSAFAFFLNKIDSPRPDSIDSPLVALFLLVLDLAMNPTEGFPYDILHYESFIDSVDAGTRFVRLCLIIKDKHPEFKDFIKNYSSSEYIAIATQLSNALAWHSPLAAANKICEWAKTKQSLIQLMLEEKTFEFSSENQPIRLLFSKFIRYQQDKLSNPAIFCWAGVYMAGKRCSHENLSIFLEHQALFCDKADGDIYPRLVSNKEAKNVQKTFDAFYTWLVSYDLCRQWIVKEGKFDYDYFQDITRQYSIDELEEWGKSIFKQAYGVNIDDFKIL